MKESIFGLSIALLVSIELSSCGSGSSSASKEVDQDKVYQNFEIQYVASNNTTEYRATFSKGDASGIRLSLSEPSRISVNGQIMSNSDTYPVYTLKVFGQPQAQVEFVWVDSENKTYTNSIDNVSVNFIDPPTIISKATTANIAWSGNSSSSGDSSSEDRVELRLRSLVDSQYAESYAEAGASVVKLEPSHIKSIKTGSAEMRLRRVALRPLADATEAGGKISISYEAQLKKIQITNLYGRRPYNSKILRLRLRMSVIVQNDGGRAR